MISRPPLLFHCQHSLGLGHLVRTYALVQELARSFDVSLLSGGAEPGTIAPPRGVEVIALPALGADLDGALHSVSGSPMADVLAERRRLVLETFEAVRPHVLAVELFPFGRKKLAAELLPLLEAARESDTRPFVVCSLRDILVDRGARQAEHDERASLIANAYFDAVLVHADPAFARLEESFRPRTPLAIPVRYTGYVVPVPSQRRDQRVREEQRLILVSAGGGAFGSPLLEAALAARPLLPPDLTLRLVAGPFLPEQAWADLKRKAADVDGVELVRSVEALEPELARATASISQCGYNTALALVRTRVPALVVPFAERAENEQLRRARRLERLGALRVLEAERLDAATFSAEVHALLDFQPRPIDLNVDGARRTSAELTELIGARSSRRRGPGTAWLDPLRRVLAEHAGPVTIFFRNDDVGWQTDALLPLLDLFAEHGAPLDLAAIPTVLDPALAAELARRHEGADARIGVHQHGYAHVNHESDGRKAEFGTARTAEEQAADIEAGRTRLRELLGDLVDPIFTPPWNRCTNVTGTCLAQLEFRAVSRESRAAPLGVAGLAELPVTVDWFGHPKGARMSRVEAGLLAAIAAGSAQPVGIMLHHTELDDDQLRSTRELLEMLSASESVRFRSMTDALSESVARPVSSWDPVGPNSRRNLMMPPEGSSR